jgi:hypothetical protein
MPPPSLSSAGEHDALQQQGLGEAVAASQGYTGYGAASAVDYYNAYYSQYGQYPATGEY